eukprot:11327654-Alexandrium_andersonii.AAC.1
MACARRVSCVQPHQGGFLRILVGTYPRWRLGAEQGLGRSRARLDCWQPARLDLLPAASQCALDGAMR